MPQGGDRCPVPAPHLVIDARPRGPRGPLAGERVLGRTVLAHLLDLAASLEGGARSGRGPRPARGARRLRALVADRPPGRVVFATGPPPEGRGDPAVRPALRPGAAPPRGPAGARPRVGRDLAARPAPGAGGGRGRARGDGRRISRSAGTGPSAPRRGLARLLRPTRVRPNAVTLASAALMLGASAAGRARPGRAARRAWPRPPLWRWPWCSTRPTATSPGSRGRPPSSAAGSTPTSTSWATWPCTPRSPGRPSPATAARLARRWACSTRWASICSWSAVRGPAPRPSLGWAAARPAAATRRPAPATACVRLAGHADVRWHLWIVLAALGRLDAALVAYAVYFPARTLAGAVRKAVRHA